MSEPGFVLKHRIVGALILIGFGVVVLPWILGGPDNTTTTSVPEPVQEQAKPEDDNTKVFVSRITPIGGATPPVLTVTKPQEEPRGANTTTGTKTEAKPQTTEKPKTPTPDKSGSIETNQQTAQTKPEEEVANAKQELTRGWVVRIGTFSKPENAKRVMDTLRKKGFVPKSGKYMTQAGAATRVWVGPYAKRVEAARDRARIERVTGEKGLITPYP